MDKIRFAFICSLFLLIALFGNAPESLSYNYILPCLLPVALIGIPHGAIDHILFFDIHNDRSKWLFLIFYIGVMLAYTALWLIYPGVSLLFFLVLSAYHFGQSQFADLGSTLTISHRALHFFWGISIISGLVYYNQAEILGLVDVSASSEIHDLLSSGIYLWAIWGGSILTLFWMIYLLYQKNLSKQRFFMEIYTLILIHISFFLLPLFVAFTLYFVILHSLKVLSEEFSYIKASSKELSLLRFIQYLLPLTVISILGSLLLVGLVRWEVLQFDFFFLGVMLISIVTLPHSIVMDLFYNKLLKSN